MLQFCSRLSYLFSTTQRYTIKKLNYLVVAPPSKPNNSYIAFCQQQFSGKKGPKGQGMRQAALKWKTLSVKQKQKYGKDYQQMMVNYQKEKSEYMQKYVTPFKKISGINLFMSNLYESKIIPIPKGGSVSQNGKMVGEKIKNRSKEEMAKFDKEAEQIKAERSQKIEEYKFPTRLYHSQVGCSRANPTLDKKFRAKAYRIYVKNWETQVEKWLKNKKIDIPINDFRRLYNKELKRSRSKQEQKEETQPEK